MPDTPSEHTAPNEQPRGANRALLPARIQGLLYAEGGPLTYTSLKSSLDCTDEELAQGLRALSHMLTGGGLALVMSDSEAALVISDDARDVIIAKAKAETDRDIGTAGLEVLAILLYEGPASRAEIDYIRGVNSSSTIRNLLSRGLIERIGNPNDAREYIYRPTTELLAHLGVRSREELPEYATIAADLATFKATKPSEHVPGSAAGEQSE